MSNRRQALCRLPPSQIPFNISHLARGGDPGLLVYGLLHPCAQPVRGFGANAGERGVPEWLGYCLVKWPALERRGYNGKCLRRYSRYLQISVCVRYAEKEGGARPLWRLKRAMARLDSLIVSLLRMKTMGYGLGFRVLHTFGIDLSLRRASSSSSAAFPCTTLTTPGSPLCGFRCSCGRPFAGALLNDSQVAGADRCARTPTRCVARAKVRESADE